MIKSEFRIIINTSVVKIISIIAEANNNIDNNNTSK